jgi:hypothetical protein
MTRAIANFFYKMRRDFAQVPDNLRAPGCEWLGHSQADSTGFGGRQWDIGKSPHVAFERNDEPIRRSRIWTKGVRNRADACH